MKALIPKTLKFLKNQSNKSIPDENSQTRFKPYTIDTEEILIEEKKENFNLNSRLSKFRIQTRSSFEGNCPVAGEDCHRAHHAVRGLASGW